MQIYAADDNNNRVFVENAIRSQAYFCLECRSAVYVRGGHQRHTSAHFYHRSLPENCRQHGKSARHLEIQQHISKALRTHSEQEHAFPEISRIADVFVPELRLVIEVQCSFITRQELERRTSDYRSLGLEVIWIFDDNYYGKKRVHAAEMGCVSIPHYFAVRQQFYDFVDRIQRGFRVERLFQADIDIATIHPREPIHAETGCDIVNERLHSWRYHCDNDFLSVRDCIRYVHPTKTRNLLATICTKVRRFFAAIEILILERFCSG